MNYQRMIWLLGFILIGAALPANARNVASGPGTGVSRNGDLHILAIGINLFGQRYSASDAQEFADSLERRANGVFGKVYKTTLLDEQASREGIQKAFREVSRNVGNHDTFVFYFGGLGAQLEKVGPAEFRQTKRVSAHSDFYLLTWGRPRRMLATPSFPAGNCAGISNGCRPISNSSFWIRVTLLRRMKP